ncbi:hypothetical protein F5B19DRAFT_496913 [Rostrohypoxylon terebratum]|nr:hypothetical protein F5B19DRAFT_496913 [Rostrohypoxylon terebratum]
MSKTIRAHLSNDTIIRLARLPLSATVISLSFDFHYPIWTYHVALAGVVFFWGVIQVFDMECGGTPEINMVIHLCFDALSTVISVTMVSNLGLMKACDIGDHSGCRHYWWVMCLWGILALSNGLLVHYDIRKYPSRRRGSRRLTPRIMFTPSGDPVAVTLSPTVSGQTASSRHSLGSLPLPRIGPRECQ